MQRVGRVDAIPTRSLNRTIDNVPRWRKRARGMKEVRKRYAALLRDKEPPFLAGDFRDLAALREGFQLRDAELYRASNQPVNAQTSTSGSFPSPPPPAGPSTQSIKSAIDSSKPLLELS
jgi:hypothetical protein